ncbi:MULTISPECIES: hypothetical protein [Thermoactinomycetaceae]|uniref:Uncharacterized protein n=1 Tax=Croceifilum oryzae TaxID=1553429 RepID=A0AAJ1WT28_9BACL|nr:MULTISPECIES: hypothetical protein [Thermoactinomycetaceae]MDQ0417598.1 hypothetical protein [Croceifilum oryzae]
MKKELLKGNMEEARELAFQVDFDDLHECLIGLSHETGSMFIYTFGYSLLLKQESAKLHELLYVMLSISLPYIEGAYESSLYHARRAAALDPDDVEYKSCILLFHEIPDQLVSKEEAVEIAKEIITVDPTNSAATKILLRYGIA